MNAQFFKGYLSVVFMSFFIYAQASEQFVPNQKTCGAAIQATGEHVQKRTTENQIECMIAGYKHVYLGNVDELQSINKKYSLKDLGIKVLLKDNQLTYINLQGKNVLLFCMPVVLMSELLY